MVMKGPMAYRKARRTALNGSLELIRSSVWYIPDKAPPPNTKGEKPELKEAWRGIDRRVHADHYGEIWSDAMLDEK